MRTISYEREFPALDGERSKPYLHRMGMRALSRWGRGSRRALLWASLAGALSFGLVAGFGKAPAELASASRDPLESLLELGGADDQVVLMATRDANNECCIIRRVRVGQAAGRRPASAPAPKRF